MHPRKALRIARWEVTKNAGGIDRRTVLLGVIAVTLLGAIGPVVAGSGVSLDAAIYRVGVATENPYNEVATGDRTFAVVRGANRTDLEADRIEILVHGDRVIARSDQKGRAAMESFRSAVERFNRQQLATDDNHSAAFPVRVTLRYREQTGDRSTFRVTEPTTREGGAGEDAGVGDVSRDGSDRPTEDAGDTGNGRSGASGVGGLGARLGNQDRIVNSPASISPPFPFRSLILAFVFVIPLNFLIQAYGSTILSERLNRRGELLLVSPVNRVDVIVGKTLPYFLGAIAVEGAIALGLSLLVTGKVGGILSLAAIAPLIALFLAATFLGAMLARSFKELTFMTVTITVTLTSYAFVPAVFTDVGAVALVSPLTIVVRDLGGEAVGLAEFAFSVTPPTLTALTLFGLGAGLYREEDMFTQRAIPLKILDALAGPIHRPWHVGLITAVLLPFVFLAELIAVAVLFALGELSIPLVLGFVAVIEEVGKSLHIYAAHVHRRFDARLRTALMLGAASGVGFFIAEKLAILAQVVGLPELAVGRAALQTGIVSGPVLLGFLVAPLVLHIGTAAISAVGAARGRRAYVGALVGAILLHLAYNAMVLGVIGGA